MARGWESKSVEEQQSEASRPAEPGHSAEELVLIRQKESLQLERTRIVRELDAARNARHREMLTQALAYLDGKLAALDPPAAPDRHP